MPTGQQKYTEARKQGNQKWDAANLDRISVALPRGKKEEIKEAATRRGETMNQYIKIAIDNRLAQEEPQQPAADNTTE
nr:MAG TPA: Alginate and motility regulator [Bacteriophage sp.]